MNRRMARHVAFFGLVFSLVLVSGFWFVSIDREWRHYYPPTTEQMMLAEEKGALVVLPQDDEVIDDIQGNPDTDLQPSHDDAKESKVVEVAEDDVAKESPVTVEDETTTEITQPYAFICDTVNAKPLQPILMIASARTGSNLFFSFLERLAANQPDQIDLLPLYEVFGKDDSLLTSVVSRTLQQIWRGCQWDDLLWVNRTFTSPDEVFAAALAEATTTTVSQQQQQVLAELQHVFEQRFNDPAPFLKFLHRIPSASPHAFFALKVFSYHVVNLLQMSIVGFIALFSEMKDTQFVLLWRRNLLEIFVSFQIANQRNAWVNTNSTDEDAIQVEASKLEWFVQETAGFYQQARDYFESQSILYHVFEYDRDLSNMTQQMDTVQRIQTQILLQTTGWTEELMHTVVDHPGTAKQATVPLSQQIVNWEEVQSWGYSESSLDWHDLFSNHTSD